MGEYSQFVFPIVLTGDNIDHSDDSSSEEDQDTDSPSTSQLGTFKTLMNSKIFTDPTEREKWKARGWRAVQCCGGALVVLALIFDELDSGTLANGMLGIAQ